jgi:hypothetical protein
VSSVPYWDERCGMKFEDAEEFRASFGTFLERLQDGAFSPRDYITENLTLEVCARCYAEIVEETKAQVKTKAHVKRLATTSK